MACLLPSVIDAVDVVDAVNVDDVVDVVDVVDAVDVNDADSVDDVLWIPRVERLRQSRRHHRPSHRCCLSHRHQPAPDPLHTFFNFLPNFVSIICCHFVVKLCLSVFLVALLYAGPAMGVCQLELLRNRLYSQRH